MNMEKQFDTDDKDVVVFTNPLRYSTDIFYDCDVNQSFLNSSLLQQLSTSDDEAQDSLFSDQDCTVCPLCSGSVYHSQKGRVQECKACEKRFCLMCLKEYKKSSGCGWLSGFCALFFWARFGPSPEKLNRKRRGCCAYWTAAMWFVLLYPVWGLFYWTFRAVKDVGELFQTNCPFMFKCNIPGHWGKGILGDIITIIRLVIIAIVLVPFATYLAIGYIFGLFYIYVCPCLFSNRK